jgi:hypothetical protein
MNDLDRRSPQKKRDRCELEPLQFDTRRLGADRALNAEQVLQQANAKARGE